MADVSRKTYERLLRDHQRLRADHDVLKREFAQMREELAAARQENAELRRELAAERIRHRETRRTHDALVHAMGRLKERVAYFVRREFGASSERMAVVDGQGFIPGCEEAMLEELGIQDDPELRDLFRDQSGADDSTTGGDERTSAESEHPAVDADAEKAATAPNPQAEDSSDDKKTEKKRRKRPANAGGRKPIPEIFPRIDSTYEPPKDHPALVNALKSETIGTRTIEQFDLTQLDIVVQRITCPVMRLHLPGGIRTQHTMTPPAIVDGGQVSDHFLVVSAVDKIADHLPCYRQEQRLKRCGAEIPRAKLCRWMITMAQFLQVIADAMLDEMLQQPVLGIDDTVHRLVVPDSPVCKNGRLWAISSPSGILYNFQDSRSGDWIAETLQHFTGGIMGDAYSGHNALLARPEIIAIFCWAHARRKFVESADKRRRRIILAYISKLYEIERDIAENPPESIAAERIKRAGPIMAKIHEILTAWEADPAVLPKSGIGAATNYVLSRWEGFQAYLTLDHAPIDNNRTEQGMRPNALHRKNSLFSATTAGAEAYATLSSLIVSARMHDLNPIDYLSDIISDLHYQRRPAAELTPAAYAMRQGLGVELSS